MQFYALHMSSGKSMIVKRSAFFFVGRDKWILWFSYHTTTDNHENFTKFFGLIFFSFLLHIMQFLTFTFHRTRDFIFNFHLFRCSIMFCYAARARCNCLTFHWQTTTAPRRKKNNTQLHRELRSTHEKAETKREEKNNNMIHERRQAVYIGDDDEWQNTPADYALPSSDCGTHESIKI